MKIKAEVTYECEITDEEVEKFRQWVLERIQMELENDYISIDVVSKKVIESYLRSTVTVILEDIHGGYSSHNGVMLDAYFNTISFDYDDGEVRDMVWEIADEIIAEIEDEYTPSAENGDYSPSNPWDAPGMSISDFI